MKTRHAAARGFIALMSVILISFVFLLIAASSSLSGFYTSTTVIHNEQAVQARSNASTCAHTAFLQLTQNPSYTGNTIFSLSAEDFCRIGPITLITPAQQKFRIQATSTSAVANLDIIYATTTGEIIFWKEIPTF